MMFVEYMEVQCDVGVDGAGRSLKLSICFVRCQERI